MKIRQLADAAIVAALLMTSLPVPEPLMPPELPSAACTVPADAEGAEDPAARKP